MSNNKGVQFVRDDYLLACRKWRQIRDIIGGDIILKDHDYYAQRIKTATVQLDYGVDSIGTKQDSYLRTVNPSNNSAENRERNAQYIKCAVLLNATSHTQSGMNGMIYRRPPVVELTPNTEYLLTDTDGNGTNLVQQMKSTSKNVIAVGRHGLFVDFPSMDREVTVNDVQSGVRAHITEYQAEQIINWKTDQFGAVYKLSMVVLQEFEEVALDDFATELQKIYRVLRLVDGLYVHEVHRINLDGKETIEVFEPKDGSGNRMDFLPFAFVGAENNDQQIDKAPLYDLSVVNIGHYRNSADVEENSFFASQTTVTATGMTQQWIDDVWQGEATVGSRSVLTGPEGSGFGMIQANESNLARGLMSDKENQMVQLGAKLLESQGNKTATQAEMDSADSTSVLANISTNVQDAYIDCIKWVQLYMNDSGDIELELNKKFGTQQLSAQEITALVAAMQAGAISIESLLWNMKQGHRMADDTAIDEELERITANGVI